LKLTETGRQDELDEKEQRRILQKTWRKVSGIRGSVQELLAGPLGVLIEKANK
jgi:hypothetical protein